VWRQGQKDNCGKHFGDDNTPHCALFYFGTDLEVSTLISDPTKGRAGNPTEGSPALISPQWRGFF
jgi:hypothetical protein